MWGSILPGRQVMRNSVWGYLIAIAAGGISQIVAFVEQPWLSQALLYLAIVIALLATLGLTHALGLLRSIATGMRSPRLERTGTLPADGKTPTNAAARIQTPRPAGPAGPVPVLQKRPTDVPTAAPGAVRGKNPQNSSDAE
jgi:hypothetical protein